MAPSFFQNKQVKIGLAATLLLLGNLLDTASAFELSSSPQHESSTQESSNSLTPTERALYITLGSIMVATPPAILLCAGVGAFCLAVCLLSYGTNCFGCTKPRGYDPF